MCLSLKNEIFIVVIVVNRIRICIAIIVFIFETFLFRLLCFFRFVRNRFNFGCTGSMMENKGYRIGNVPCLAENDVR